MVTTNKKETKKKKRKKIRKKKKKRIAKCEDRSKSRQSKKEKYGQALKKLSAVAMATEINQNESSCRRLFEQGAVTFEAGDG